MYPTDFFNFAFYLITEPNLNITSSFSIFPWCKLLGTNKVFSDEISDYNNSIFSIGPFKSTNNYSMINVFNVEQLNF